MNELEPKEPFEMDPLLYLLVENQFYGNEIAYQRFKQRQAIEKLPILDKQLREPTEFNKAETRKYGCYPITNYFYNTEIGININGINYTTKHIRIVEFVGRDFNTYKLKIIKNLKKRENIPFELEDIETISIFKVKKSNQTVLGGF
jgi:hypothetical protein